MVASKRSYSTLDYNDYIDFTTHLLHTLLHTLLHSAEMTYAELQEELPFPTKLVTVALPGEVAQKPKSMCYI